MGLFDIFKGKKDQKEQKPEPVATFEVNVRAKASEKSSIGYHRDGTALVQELSSLGDGRVVIRKWDRMNLDAPEPCGFTFENALVQTDGILDTETGELANASHVVYFEGDNQEKLEDALVENFAGVVEAAKEVEPDLDADGAMDLANYLLAHVPSWPDDETRIKSNLINGDVVNGEYERIRISCHGKVEELTPTGKVKKFPVLGVMTLDAYPPFGTKKVLGDLSTIERWLHVSMKFLPSGEVGGIEINSNLDDNWYIVKAAKLKDGSWQIKSVKDMNAHVASMRQ